MCCIVVRLIDRLVVAMIRAAMTTIEVVMMDTGRMIRVPVHQSTRDRLVMVSSMFGLWTEIPV
jgi:hypothetical protein